MSEVFTTIPGEFVPINETIQGFKALLEGQGDEYPENSFLMVGNLEKAFAKGRKLA